MEVPRKSKWPMVPMDDAIELVLGMAEYLPLQKVSLAEAVGRVLAEDVLADQPQPPFAASTKDGYAIVADDGPCTVRLLGEVSAGLEPKFAIQSGSAAYVTTGAPVPPGADAVIQVEWTREGVSADSVILERQVKVGNDIRPIGSDVARGQLVLSKGESLGAAEIGILASCGISSVGVFGRPKVALMSTGDELVDGNAGEAPKFGQIYDSNRPMMREMIVEAGGEVIDMGIAPDDAPGVSLLFDRALNEADIVLSSGGISMGNKDLVKGEIERRGQVHFGRVLMKPGKPLTFATVEQHGNPKKLVLAMPGNPVSSYVCFHLVVAPAIRKLCGHKRAQSCEVQVKLARAIQLDPERPEFHRASLQWDSIQSCFIATSTGSQASSRLLSTRSANALLKLPRGNERLEVGSIVNAVVIGSI